MQQEKKRRGAYPTDSRKERYILVGVATESREAEEASLSELSALLETAGGEAVFTMIQSLDRPDPATYIGSGKAEELRPFIEMYEADGILCDDELTPAQIRNLTEFFHCAVIDRTILILDIFAKHARTNEGKIQVEMAQQKYRLSHLSGLGKSLSRQGGGIGTRGPGETKLETDRRLIRKRIAALSGEISEMKRVRETKRRKREQNEIPVIAIIGYTNAGKSTLLNRLTDSGVLAEDKLFATLDPTTRTCRLAGGRKILLTDTVGFINKLPHHLIDAFRSTLEEAKYADILLHVVDISDPEADRHIRTVYDTLSELGIREKPVLTVLNKTDLISAGRKEDISVFRDPMARRIIKISAATGDGITELLSAVSGLLSEEEVLLDQIFPYDQSDAAARIRIEGRVISEEYLEDGIHIRAYVRHR
ncbi:MAG: GTPase HflX [Lachnospiraceae bacterium]|nr:GTPase HflX [Lachnospiraceae bacterium]